MPLRAIVAPPDQALVVFLRPSAYGGSATFTVIDSEGRFLGQPGGEQYWLRTMPPGRYTFVSWCENADMMNAEVAAGRIYYVLISSRMGWINARTSISALTPRREEWVRLGEYLRESRQMDVDVTGGQAWLDAREAQRRLASAREGWARYGPEDQARRTLTAADGMTSAP